MVNKTYTELSKLSTFLERYRYLRLDGKVGSETFGVDRFMNQYLYQRDPRWKRKRRDIILRDNGCDLGIPDRPVFDKIFIHHMNPITLMDIENDSDLVWNEEFLICVSFRTHQAIHYGDESLLILPPPIRMPNDTCPWKNVKKGG